MLSLRPRWRENESPLSLFTRAAAVCAERDVRNFAWRYRLEIRDIALGRANAKLSELTGHPESEIEKSAVKVADSRAIFMGQELRVPIDWSTGSSMASGARRFCPGCLADDLAEDGATAGPLAQRAYLRSWWDVRTIVSCVVHKTPLRSNCGICGAKVGGWSHDLTRCPSCGISLARVDQLKLPEDDLLADRYVMGRLGLGPAIDVPVATSLPIYYASDLMAVLGALKKSGHGSKSNLRPRNQNPEDKARTMSDGLRVLANWPYEFDAILDRQVTTAHPREGGLRSTYGAIYNWLVDKSEDELNAPHFKLVVDRMRSHALRTIPFGDGAKFLREEIDESTYVSFRHAAKLREVNVGNFVLFARRAGLLTEDDRRLRRIRADLVRKLPPGNERRKREELQACASWAYHLGDLPDVLGVCAATVGLLRTANVLPAPLRHDWMELWRHEDLANFLRRCGAGLPVIDVGNLTTVTKISAPTAAILSCILEGKIVPKGSTKTGVGLGSILVSKEDVWASDIGRTGALDLDEAASRLGISRKELKALCSLKALATKPRGVGNFRMIDLRTIESFEDRYISLESVRSSLARLSRIETRRRLSDLGVDPTIATGGVWYRREEIGGLPELSREVQRRGLSIVD